MNRTKIGHGGGERRDDAHRAEAEGDDGQEDGGVLGHPGGGEVGEASAAAHHGAALAGDEQEGREGHEGRARIDRRAEDGARVAETGLPQDRHDPEAHRRQEGQGELPRTHAQPPAADRQQGRAGDDHDRPREDGQGHALAEQQHGEAGRDQGIQVDQRRGDRGADRLDADEAQEPAAGGADEAGEREQGEAVDGEAAEPFGKNTAIQRPVVPTTRLIQKPVNGVPPRRP